MSGVAARSVPKRSFPRELMQPPVLVPRRVRLARAAHVRSQLESDSEGCIP